MNLSITRYGVDLTVMGASLTIGRWGFRLYTRAFLVSIGSRHLTLRFGSRYILVSVESYTDGDVRDAAEPFMQAHPVRESDADLNAFVTALSTPYAAGAAQTVVLNDGVPEYNPFLVEQEFVDAVASSYESYERAIDVMLDANDAYKAGFGTYEQYEEARDAADDARAEYEHALRVADARMDGWT